ncbi:MAG: hypothetical protein ACFFBP_22035, partial [Promethearchaeota archaeon]
MSKKVAFASVLCLILGGISLPGGMVVNNIITDMTYNSIDQGLLGIKDQAIPIIEPMVKELGVAEALRQILDIGVPAVDNMIKEIGPAMTLSIIREVGGPAVEDIIRQIGPAIALSLILDQSIPYVEEIVNASFLTQVLYNAHDIAESGTPGLGGGCLLNLFFDYYTLFLGPTIGWTDFSLQLELNGLPPIKSIAHWKNESI